MTGRSSFFPGHSDYGTKTSLFEEGTKFTREEMLRRNSLQVSFKDSILLTPRRSDEAPQNPSQQRRPHSSNLLALAEHVAKNVAASALAVTCFLLSSVKS